jgi:hypothetical protein
MTVARMLTGLYKMAAREAGAVAQHAAANNNNNYSLLLTSYI